MSTEFEFSVDGETIVAKPGQTIMDACDDAGVYIPRLCDVEGLVPQGSCRVCTVKVNGRTAAACTQPAEPGVTVENDTPQVQGYRRDLVRMLFHEGNHLCPICEASGRCELQAMAYRLGISQDSLYPYLQPVRPVDASHPDIALDTNRCILCGRCIRASRDVDGKNIFEYVGRGIHKRIGVNAENLAASDASIDDYAMSLEVCPVGCIIRKREGFFAPIGQRQFDNKPIGWEIEARHKNRIAVHQIDPSEEQS
ncbi:2Fe-2S iron-sulfur cluster binding domain-containing protein [Hahella sp. KA22]|uniref:2Fe-2S iron-sulfur cluster-binding protein n=1 Tax=Hahella sp. KA22 TaxID=1628392 RepID=UPI000FDE48FE|nr:2Fe-2S iron-sulfur cluster-binding protein [Hahella sp. KA22]AZZ89740.1 2Fe-2S iron-sulfur cluster binding domain-containing protein [Hahella sp. KA22]QAY53110.1 2Fe-2S iron-sulfur cluster binding domain-containing protein [Hahella sp. KA22]